MVDLTRGADGVLRARLLEMAPGRFGTVYKTWLDARTPAFRTGVKHAALDPFRGYANALCDGLGDAVAVLDAFHVVKLGTQVMDEVRRRVQQQTLHRRGHRDDPLYKIRGLLRHGAENLTSPPDKAMTILSGVEPFCRAVSTGSVLVAAGGSALSGLALEVLRQTVRPLVVRRRNRCWDDVAPPGGGEHLTIRSPAVSSTLLTVSESNEEAQCCS
jgi:hypothetical protein